MTDENPPTPAPLINCAAFSSEFMTAAHRDPRVTSVSVSHNFGPPDADDAGRGPVLVESYTLTIVRRPSVTVKEPQ